MEFCYQVRYQSMVLLYNDTLAVLKEYNDINRVINKLIIIITLLLPNNNDIIR